MAGLYRSIEDDVTGLFAAGWSHPDVPVRWRANDLDPLPDSGVTRHFLRATVLFGPEVMTAFGGGPLANQKTQFGFLEIIGFASRDLVTEATLLDLLWDATSTVRSKRVTGTFAGGSDLSFIGDGSQFHVDPGEDGNWFIRGCRMVFEYRFIA